MTKPLPDYLVLQWHPLKNGVLEPSDVSAGSNRKIWWLGACGHEWEASASKRSSGRGCPYCSGNKTLSGFNDLASVNPKLSSEWHPTKNGELKAYEVSSKSNRKVWWLGVCGHSWEAYINNRSKGATCPYCSNKKTNASNSLQSNHPELALQWSQTLNGDLTPEDVTPGSRKKVWWIDEYGHEWEARVHKRVSRQGCPYCSGKSLLSGFNDLPVTHSLIAKEWHPTRNLPTLPDEVSKGSEVKIWWVCSVCSHEWEAFVYSRTAGKGCPACAVKKFNFVSQPEKELNSFLESLGLDVKQSDRSALKGVPYKEIDLYIPEKKIGVEFNGLYWHSEAAGKDKHYHHGKWSAAKAAGVQLIQVWEDDWNRNPELVKRMLAHKLGVSQERTVFARRTRVEELGKVAAEPFLDSYHIQGHASGSYYLGLEDKETGEVIAVLVLKKEAGSEGRTLNIIRYATSVNLVGGFTKLLKHAERTYKPDSFITFADHTVSDGGLYENNAFVADKELPPDYMYVVRGERKHKFGYRLKRFRNEPTLKYEEGLTERELAALNNLPRIWDAGKTRYRKDIQ